MCPYRCVPNLLLRSTQCTADSEYAHEQAEKVLDAAGSATGILSLLALLVQKHRYWRRRRLMDAAGNATDAWRPAVVRSFTCFTRGQQVQILTQKALQRGMRQTRGVLLLLQGIGGGGAGGGGA